MPRRPLDLGLAVEALSILDEKGHVDHSLEPNVDSEDLRRLLRTMILVRAYDDQRLRLQRQGRIGTFAPVRGQEAAQLGSVFAIDADDWVVPSFRELAVAVWRGQPLEDDLLYCAGHEEGLRIGPDARDLPIAIPVASQLPHAVGLAWGLRLQGSDRIVLCYFGDGATSEGDFHEALNLASLHQVPVVFFCQNNQWAISVPREQQTRSRTLAQKAFAYDMPCLVVDGNDLLAVIAATREAVDRARAGRGPTFLEAVTYRMGVHTTADDPTLYRAAGEVRAWERKDPLVRLRTYLADRGALTQNEEARWREEAEATVREAVRRFEATPPPDPRRMFEHLLSAPTPELERQREDLEARIERRAKEAPAEAGEAPPDGQRTGAGAGPREATAAPKETAPDQPAARRRGRAPRRGRHEETQGRRPDA